MKRSEMLHEVCEILHKYIQTYSDLAYVADTIMDKIEAEGMLPPGYMKPIPFESDGKQYPLVPGDFKNENGVWCAPGQNEWEPE